MKSKHDTLFDCAEYNREKDERTEIGLKEFRRDLKEYYTRSKLKLDDELLFLIHETMSQIEYKLGIDMDGKKVKP